MGFQAAAVAKEIGRCIAGPMRVIAKGDADLGDQIRRATISTVLNVNEASRRIGRDRINRFRTASGSAREVVSAIELAVDWRIVARESVRDVLTLLDRLLAMLWRLEHPRR